MSNKKTFHDIILVTLSNVFAIIAGIVSGFLIPKIFSVEEYGLYKTFTLYTTYMGLFNLGIADGIVLKYGSYDYEKLNQISFRSYFKWFELVHILLCGVLIILGFLSTGEVRFILVALAFNTIIINTIGYFQQISQITQRFKEFSIRKIIQAGSGIIITGTLFLLYYFTGFNSYHVYLELTIIFSLFLSFWYFSTYRKIVFGKSISLRESAGEIKGFIQAGFPLLFSNLCSTLILTLDRQFVNILFPKAEYAVYAFAYNLLSMVTVATSATSTVLFPTLKRTSKENLNSLYTKIVGIMLVFVYGAMIGYYPLYVFINWFLPKYNESLLIFRIIFPGLAISSCITVIMHNYYKVLGFNLRYFKKSIVVLIISALANGVAYYFFRTTSSISIASIFTMIIWYLYIERLFIKEFKINTKRNLIYMISMGASFYLITWIPNIYLSGILYVFVFCIMTYIIKRDVVTEILHYIKKQ